MKNFVNRRARDYHEQRLIDIQDLDLIASWFLVLSWSRRQSQTPQTQKAIQFDCVACIYVNNELWVAANSQRITADDIAEFKSSTGLDIPIWIVTNGTPNKMHAEMQLVSQLQQEGKVCIPNYMGVSKPCCKYCAQVLNQMNINYANWHNSSVTNWEEP